MMLSLVRGLCVALIAAVAAAAEVGAVGAAERHQLVVYGATSAGVVAAIQARQLGLAVIVVEPGQHVGGLTAGGLGATDIGNKAAIGGLAREFYRRIGSHYENPTAWTREAREAYQEKRESSGEAEMWTFEPHVAERVFRDWLAEASVEVVFGERLDLGAGGVTKDKARIMAIRMESGREFKADMFIDATYEGDLMAKAGVAYHVGREPADRYGESLAGVQVARATKHQFTHDVDPYLTPGDPASGLVPLVSAQPPGVDGTGDRRVQAYTFRICTTDVPENRGAWPQPEGYDEKTYELLLRNFEAGDERVPWRPVWMPNRKTDTNNNFAISTDSIGGSDGYPDGDYATRERIVDEHRRYQQGLLWTLANHPRVPEEVRAEFRRLGPAQDEFVDNGNWPHQIYVREARRMVSDQVMTQHHCQQRLVAEDSVGLGAYAMDSHHCQRFVTRDGKVRNEGDIQVPVSPYRISYRSIRPRLEECENLLVPVCLAASHIAYGSIRMEPVFMVLGQSAATAAAVAIADGVPVQKVDYPKLRERLVAAGQVLVWPGAAAKPAAPRPTGGIVIDDERLSRDFVAKLGGMIASGTTLDGPTAAAALVAAEGRKAPPPPAAGATTVAPGGSLYEAVAPTVVVVGSVFKCGKCNDWHLGGIASGWLVSPDGAVFTNHHVFLRDKEHRFGIMTADGSVFPVTDVMAADAAGDAAIVRIDTGGRRLPFLAIGSRPAAGDPVTVISHPVGRFYTLTQGVVSRFHCRRPTPSPGRPAPTGGEPAVWMSVTADYAVGSSGGPVFDPAGRVVGMVSRTSGSLPRPAEAKPPAPQPDAAKSPAAPPQPPEQMVFKDCVSLDTIRGLLERP